MEAPTSLLLCAFCRSMLRVRCGRCLKCNLEQAHQVKIQPASGDHRNVYEIFRWQILSSAHMGDESRTKHGTYATGGSQCWSWSSLHDGLPTA